MAAQPPPSSSSSRRTRAGDKSVGSFSIEDEIGKGSFATVYRGTHKSSGALVAVKSVNLAKLNKKLKENLYCEIEILKGLHHPHIVALIDCRESSTHIHLVMEYCELGDLSYFIKKRESLGNNPALQEMITNYPNPRVGGLNEVVVRHFLKQLASAMEFLRDRNFIHRDVKPQNLLLLPSPKYLASSKNPPLVMSASQDALVPMVGLTSLPMLKLADFGFARSLPSTSLAETLCGSPLYMAPEILRYEKYDAKADLWSVGTVLFEMMTGKPPFRATNHVELLRKIEQSDDVIKFPSQVELTSGMKSLIKSLLKRQPVERLSFVDFFNHSVVKEPIPGLCGDDRPKETSRPIDALKPKTMRRLSSHATQPSDSSSPPVSRPVAHNLSGTPPRPSSQAGPSSPGLRRPSIIPSATAPNAETIRLTRQASLNTQRPPVSRYQTDEGPKGERKHVDDDRKKEAMAEAEQAVRDEREYVLVEKKAVEVNAFADEMAANPNLQNQRQNPSHPKTMTRRATTQGSPASVTGAVPASPSRAVQIAQGKPRPDVVPQAGSFGRSYGSPSGTSAIAKALHGASVRVFGVGWSPHLIGKGASPPPMYTPYPAYPAPNGTVGLLGENRSNGPIDEDQRAVNIIEESATRSDVVFGFAEVKYKQLVPLAPSMDQGLGGPAGAKTDESNPDDDGLTTEAIVSLSEEALVLYVKALALLAKSMDIAGAWWSRKSRGEAVGGTHGARTETASQIAAGNRINSAVQWVRGRFNEVLEKAEIVRLKLLEAQKQLPEDHPAHPNNNITSSKLAGTSSTEGIVLTPGLSAEKLMYDRALEMSRSAAISEIANEDLRGCEISYVTAIRMLEAVLENDDELPTSRRRSSSLKDEREEKSDESIVNGINLADRQAVLKVVSMIQVRLSNLQKKMALIAKQKSLSSTSPRPRSMTQNSGSTTPTVNTPPH